MWVYVWLGVTVLALVVEFFTNDLLSVWFAGGGIVALIISAFNVPWYVHVPVFLAVSFVLLLCLRKIAVKHFSKGDTKINADSAIGKIYVLTSPIAFNQPGTIKINDVVWSAISEDNTPIEQGRKVKVLDIKGNKYIVEEVK